MIELVESTIERNVSGLRALDAVTGANTAAAHPAASVPRPAAPGSGPTGRVGAAADSPRNLEDLYREHRTRFVRLAVLLVDTPATAEDVVPSAAASWLAARPAGRWPASAR